jgi:hypothetical protein
MRVGFDHRFAGSLGLFIGLLSLRVVREDLRPGRRNKNSSMITERPSSPVYMQRNRYAAQPQVTGNVWNSAIKNYRAAKLERGIIRSHIPAQHQFGESVPIGPRQSVAADRHLIANDRPASLWHARNAMLCQCFDERTFSRSRSSCDYEQAVGRCEFHGVSFLILTPAASLELKPDLCSH